MTLLDSRSDEISFPCVRSSSVGLTSPMVSPAFSSTLSVGVTCAVNVPCRMMPQKEAYSPAAISRSPAFIFRIEKTSSISGRSDSEKSFHCSFVSACSSSSGRAVASSTSLGSSLSNSSLIAPKEEGQEEGENL